MNIGDKIPVVFDPTAAESPAYLGQPAPVEVEAVAVHQSAEARAPEPAPAAVVPPEGMAADGMMDDLI